MTSSADLDAKRQLLAIVAELPDDSSFDQILRELAFHRTVERGLADARRGASVSHGTLSRRVRTWIDGQELD
ncbi:MAG: hypothetical protein AAGN46_09565 [Acidobacteriota bacterium]